MNNIKKKTVENQTPNYYTKIDKSLLIKTPNPNYHLHNLDIPFRGVIVAPSGSGKTNFLLDIIQKFCTGKGTFVDIIIITQNKDEPLYNHLESKGVIIKEGLHNTPVLDDYDKSVAHLLIFDDLVIAKEVKMIETYYLRCRKLNVSVIFLSQRYTPIPLMIRENTNYLFVLKMGNKRSIKLMMSEFSLSEPIEELMKLYEYATKGKFNVLLIDKETSDNSKKYRKNFSEYLNTD